MRKMVEIHAEVLRNIGTMEELGTVWSINRMAQAIGSSTETAMIHCRIAELHNRVQLLKKDRGFIVMPTCMANKIKE